MNVIIFTNIKGIFFQRTLGAYQIAHHLRNHNYTVQVIDFTDYFTTEELCKAADKFIDSSTLAVGVSTTFYKGEDSNEFMPADIKRTLDFNEFPENVLETLSYIKSNHANIKFVAGGARTELLQNNPMIDKVIQGYAEDEMLKYIDFLSGKFKIRTNFNIENLNHKFLAQDVIMPNETLPIEISRGCIFKCTFCAFPLNGKSKMDYLRSPEEIKEELISNYENFGTTNYFLGDDTFNDSTFKLEQLHKIFTSLPFKIKFTTYLRLDLLNAHREQVDLLKEMGLASPFFGIETFNKKSGSIIGKGMDPNKAKDFLLELEGDLWKKQIPIICSFIVGLPYETTETVTETFEWVKKTPLNSVFFPLIINDKKFYKSEFTKKYKDFGYTLDRDTGYWESEHFNYHSAGDLAEKFNSELSKKENYPSAWFMMSLLNHGYSMEELLKTPIKELSLPRIIRARHHNVKEYKRRLFSL